MSARDELEQRLRAACADESTIDVDEHVRQVAETITDAWDRSVGEALCAILRRRNPGFDFRPVLTRPGDRRRVALPANIHALGGPRPAGGPSRQRAG